MQLLALISDTYRSLKSRGLYWALLYISLGLGGIYASLGCNDKGWSIFFGLLEFPNPELRAGTDWERSLLLTTLEGVMDYWMMTFAVLLALFPATTIFPDTMRSGAIDLLLSKPISRLKLFCGKYLGALLFVSMLALILSTICFVSLLVRLNTAYWGIFCSVGLTALIFSFIYSVNVLVGVWTRGNVSALLLTLLFWVFLWVVQKIEFESGLALRSRSTAEMQTPDMKSISSTLMKVHRLSGRLMDFLPRTRETGELFRRVVAADAPYSFQEVLQGVRMPSSVKVQLAEPQRPFWKIVGAGLIFEAVALLLAYWNFATRDF